MTRPETRERAHLVVLGAAVLYVLVLFLDWQRTSVEIPGAIDVESSSSGWAGLGLLGGTCAVALVGLEIARLRGGGPHAGALAAVALLLLAATALEVVTGDAEVQVGTAGAGVVTVDSTLWPAWLALALALAAAAAALVAFTATPRHRAGTGGATPHPSV